jgi:hypothetical protein
LLINQIFMRFITLSEEEQILVNQLEKESPNHITRLRCNLLKLSNKKLSMKEISRLTDIKWLRIVEFFNAWENAENLDKKQKTLSIKKGRGAKNKLIPVQEILPKLVQENARNLNAVLAILSEKHQINVCKVTLQNFLKEEKI